MRCDGCKGESDELDRFQTITVKTERVEHVYHVCSPRCAIGFHEAQLKILHVMACQYEALSPINDPTFTRH